MTEPKYSDLWLQEFVHHYAATGGNATQACRLMGSDALGGPGLYYKSRFSCWANGSRLLRAASQHPSFQVWLREAQKAQARAVNQSQVVPSGFGSGTNNPANDPFGAVRMEGRAARFFAERAEQKESFPPSPTPDFDPRWPAWYDKDDVLREFRGHPAQQPIKRLAMSYVQPKDDGQRNGEIKARTGTWTIHYFKREDPRWQR